MEGNIQQTNELQEMEDNNQETEEMVSNLNEVLQVFHSADRY